MNAFYVKLALHALAAFCLSGGPAAIAMADAPAANLPYLIVGGLLGAIGSGAVAGKAYLSKASTEDTAP